MITADIAIEAFLLVTGKRKRSIQDTTRLSGMFICGYGPPPAARLCCLQR
jgi:hypothetical protein